MNTPNTSSAYWFVKSEPSCYSIDDLKRDTKASWSGVRNYQARNFIQTMRRGDRVIFYHSSNPELVGAVGVAQQGSRLSVIPVSPVHFKVLTELGSGSK